MSSSLAILLFFFFFFNNKSPALISMHWGMQGLTSSIYQHTASCLQRLARLAPEHKPLLLEQLQAQATRWGSGQAGDTCTPPVCDLVSSACTPQDVPLEVMSTKGTCPTMPLQQRCHVLNPWISGECMS